MRSTALSRACWLRSLDLRLAAESTRVACSAQTTAAMISLSFVTVVTGFYAMNLRNGPWQPNGYQHDFATFYEVTPAGLLPVVC